jgi:hypothetical protein
LRLSLARRDYLCFSNEEDRVVALSFVTLSAVVPQLPVNKQYSEVLPAMAKMNEECTYDPRPVKYHFTFHSCKRKSALELSADYKTNISFSAKSSWQKTAAWSLITWIASGRDPHRSAQDCGWTFQRMNAFGGRITPICSTAFKLPRAPPDYMLFIIMCIGRSSLSRHGRQWCAANDFLAFHFYSLEYCQSLLSPYEDTRWRICNCRRRLVARSTCQDVAINKCAKGPTPRLPVLGCYLPLVPRT